MQDLAVYKVCVAYWYPMPVLQHLTLILMLTLTLGLTLLYLF